ncbi:bifunctional DNA primase/polymerase [Microbacterium sp. NPDC077057]|uniref:bifunctional DNA primase/polymerase n=1 Tax=Microbacterium sp. NPDC077057 TaxID=3154763 RepID=UPI00343D5CAB
MAEIITSNCPNISGGSHDNSALPFVPWQLHGAHLHPLKPLGSFKKRKNDETGKWEFELDKNGEKKPQEKVPSSWEANPNYVELSEEERTAKRAAGERIEPKGWGWGGLEPRLKKSDKRYGVCLTRSKLFVLDIDTHGVDGNETLREILAKLDLELDTFTVATGTGGFHYYFQLPEELAERPITKSTNLWPGVDVFPQDQQVVGPGTTRTLKDGSIGRYSVSNDVAIAEMPPRLLQAIRDRIAEVEAEEEARKEAERQANDAERQKRIAEWRASGNSFIEDNSDLYPWEQMKLDEYENDLASLLAGNRNGPTFSIFSKAGAYFGHDKRHLVEDTLLSAARASGIDPAEAEEMFPRAYESAADQHVPWVPSPSFDSRPTTTKEPRKTEMTDENDFHPTLIQDAIEKAKTLDTIKQTARKLASSSVPDGLWKQQLTDRASSLIDARRNTAKFTAEEVADAISSGIDQRDAQFDSRSTFLKKDVLEAAEEEKKKGAYPEDHYLEFNLADRFAAVYGDRVRFAVDFDLGKNWVKYDEALGIWKAVDVAEVKPLAREFLEKEYADAVATGNEDNEYRARFMKTARFLAAVISLAEGDLKTSPRDFDTRTDLKVAKNGVVDLRTGTLRAFDPALMLTQRVEVDYKPGAKSWKWDAIKASAPEDAQHFLKVWFGQALTGEPGKVILMLKGENHTGKSKYLDVQDLVSGGFEGGSSSYSFKPSPSSFTATGEVRDFSLINFLNKRLGILEELAEDHLYGPGVKRMADNTGLLAYVKHGGDVQLVLKANLVLSLNRYPGIDATDGGVLRRLCPVEFTHRYVENPAPGTNERKKLADVDKWIKDRDPELLEAALADRVEGAVLYYSDPTQVDHEARDRVPSLAKAFQNLTGNNDPVRDFLESNIVPDAGSFILATDLLQAFNETQERPWGRNTFAKRLDETLPKVFGEKVEGTERSTLWSKLEQSLYVPVKERWRLGRSKDRDGMREYSEADLATIPKRNTKAAYIAGVRFRGDNDPTLEAIVKSASEQQIVDSEFQHITKPVEDDFFSVDLDSLDDLTGLAGDDLDLEEAFSDFDA